MKTNNEHIENEFPVLEKLKSENGFKTPEGYFESLEESILSKVVSQPKERKLINYRWLGYAASVVAIAGLSTLFFLNTPNNVEENIFGEMTVEEYMGDFQEIDLELDEALSLDEVAMIEKDQY